MALPRCPAGATRETMAGKLASKKLKPIKINSYQRAECYDSRNN
jgi:hypothetical protein